VKVTGATVRVEVEKVDVDALLVMAGVVVALELVLLRVVVDLVVALELALFAGHRPAGATYPATYCGRIIKYSFCVLVTALIGWAPT
jgi:hypothetical protein